jgi:hypothetical protein
MKISCLNISVVLIVLFIVRYIILKYSPELIVNGYISIFVCFFLFTVLFTKNIYFSMIIGLLIINLRIIYRSIKSAKTLLDYNSFSNCFVFLVALLALSFVIYKFNIIDRHSQKYYGHILFVLICVTLFCLKTVKYDKNLLCFP